MNELKPEDIYKWLDEIANNENLKQCSGIPSTAEAALDLLREKDVLIAKHEAYIDNLNEDKEYLVTQIADLQQTVLKKDAEIERLRTENGILQKRLDEAETNIELLEDAVDDVGDDEVEQLEKLMAMTRAEAITEFAEETIEWCRKKLKFGKYQTIGLSGKRLEGYEVAMKAVMSYMHSLKSKDDFPNCKISGCEAARKDCHIGCPHGKENSNDS